MLFQKFIIGAIILVLTILPSHKIILANAASISNLDINLEENDYGSGSDNPYKEDDESGNGSIQLSGYKEDDEPGNRSIKLSGYKELNNNDLVISALHGYSDNNNDGKNDNNDDDDDDYDAEQTKNEAFIALELLLELF